MEGSILKTFNKTVCSLHHALNIHAPILVCLQFQASRRCTTYEPEFPMNIRKKHSRQCIEIIYDSVALPGCAGHCNRPINPACESSCCPPLPCQPSFPSSGVWGGYLGPRQILEPTPYKSHAGQELLINQGSTGYTRVLYSLRKLQTEVYYSWER